MVLRGNSEIRSNIHCSVLNTTQYRQCDESWGKYLYNALYNYIIIYSVAKDILCDAYQ